MCNLIAAIGSPQAGELTVRPREIIAHDGTQMLTDRSKKPGQSSQRLSAEFTVI
jgi:hypothetical protein